MENRNQSADIRRRMEEMHQSLMGMLECLQQIRQVLIPPSENIPNMGPPQGVQNQNDRNTVRNNDERGGSRLNMEENQGEVRLTVVEEINLRRKKVLPPKPKIIYGKGERKSKQKYVEKKKK